MDYITILHRIDAIETAVKEEDFELAHSIEDKLHIDFINEISIRDIPYADRVICSKLILSVKQLKFPRHCA